MLFPDQNQWFDPALAKYGIEMARAMTRYMYANVVPDQTALLARWRDAVANGNKEEQERCINAWAAVSSNWPRYGLITQFDRVLTYSSLAASGGNSVQNLTTNNRNWMLVSRVATTIDGSNIEQSLANITVECNADPDIILIETQPINMVFGSGQWPHIMMMPEEWPTNTFRRFTVTNNASAARTVYLGFKFLQVRTAGTYVAG